MIRIIIYLSVMFHALSQDSLYIRQIIDTLSSKAMYGRAYSFNGHIKAANYIKNELIKFGVEPYFNDYFQQFYVQSNINSEVPKFFSTTRNFILAKDFIPFYSSNSSNIRNKTVKKLELNEIDLTIDNKKLNQCVLLISLNIVEKYSLTKLISYFTKQNVSALLIETDNLTYGANYGNFSIPVIRTHKDITNSILKDSISLLMTIEKQNIKTQNITAFIPGIQNDSTIILMAHYDHLNALSKDIYFPGANDNASGVALLLELSKLLKNKKLIYNILFIFFSGEELGLFGSRHFISHENINLLKIKFIINFDMIASSEKGIMILGAEEYSKDYSIFKSIAKEKNLSNLHKRKNSAISDHYFFLKSGIKGFYLYGLGGKQAYHHINDKAESLQYNTLYEIRTLTLEYLKHQNIWESLHE